MKTCFPRWIVFLPFFFPVTPGLGADASTSADGFLHNGVTAHRGFSGRFPENTIKAFDEAIRLGADWLECDIYKTTDGKIVVIHDRDTDRVAEKNLIVAKSTWAQLEALDVAGRFREEHGLSLEACPKATIPLLEDVIRLVMKQDRTRLSIQPKQDIVDDAVALVRKMGAERWVGFNEGSLARVARVKELAPEIPVFYDTNGKDTAKHVAAAKKHGFESIVMYYKNISPEDVETIHAAGLEAGAWTVNEPATMRRLLELGIDRIYTDYPDLLKTEFARITP